MANRIKPLLATYHANQKAISSIADARIKSSGVYEKLCKQLDGSEFVREWRKSELAIVPDQLTAWIIGHHIRCAEEILQNTTDSLNSDDMQYALHTHHHRSKIIREFPENVLNRLEPVFSQSALFDTERKFEKRFDTWQKSLVSQLDQAERNTEKGKGYQTRRFDAYLEIFARAC